MIGILNIQRLCQIMFFALYSKQIYQKKNWSTPIFYYKLLLLEHLFNIVFLTQKFSSLTFQRVPSQACDVSSTLRP